MYLKCLLIETLSQIEHEYLIMNVYSIIDVTLSLYNSQKYIINIKKYFFTRIIDIDLTSNKITSKMPINGRKSYSITI